MKTKFIYLLMTLSFIVVSSFNGDAQSQMAAYQFNGSGQSVASSILNINGGGQLLIGSNNGQSDATQSDMVIIKKDANGNTVWSKSYASPIYTPLPYNWYFWGNYVGSSTCGVYLNHMDYAVDAVEVADGYVVLGTYDDYKLTWPFCGPNNHTLQSTFNYVVMKISKNTGSVMWTKTYGASGNQVPTNIQKTSDGGFIIGGFTKGGSLYDGNYGVHPFILKITANGTKQWSKVQNNFNYNLLAGVVLGGFKFPIIELQDGGFAYAASTGNETYIVKLTSAGTTEWAKVISYYGSDGGYLAPYVEDEFGLGLLAGYASFVFSPQIKEITNGTDQGNIVVVANGTFTAAALIGLLFNTGNNGWDGNGTAGYLTYNGGLFLEISNIGAYVRGSIFWHETGNSSGDMTDLKVSDIDILNNGKVLITGATTYSAYVMEYDKQVLGSSSVQAKKLGYFSYDAIPLSYDFPTSTVNGNSVNTVYDNFKYATTTLNSGGNDCTPNMTIKVIEGGNPNLTNFNPDFYSNGFTGNSLTMTASNLPVSIVDDCSGSISSRMGTEVSKEKTVMMNDGLLELNVFPNPVMSHSAFHLNWTSSDESHYVVSICDLKGQVVAEYNGVSVNGLNTKKINDDLSAGIYTVTLQTKSQLLTTKLMKQ
ncbi:MAG: T9SS type A sorting domain-containing protein [Chitinophagales bacterium]